VLFTKGRFTPLALVFPRFRSSDHQVTLHSPQPWLLWNWWRRLYLGMGQITVSLKGGTFKSSVGQLKRLTHATCWSDEISGKRDDRTGGSPVNILGRNELPGAAAYPAVHLWHVFPWIKLIKVKHWSRFIPEACLDLCLVDPFELKKCWLTTTWSTRIPELSHSSSGCQSLAFSSFSSRVFMWGRVNRPISSLLGY